MEDLKIKSVYSYLKQNGERAFLYTLESKGSPTQYSYFILEQGEDKKPHVRRLAQAINILQNKALLLTPIIAGSEEYEAFTSSLAVVFREYASKPLAPISLNKKYKKKTYPFKVPR